MLEKLPRAKEYPLIYEALPSLLKRYSDYCPLQSTSVLMFILVATKLIVACLLTSTSSSVGIIPGSMPDVE